MKYLTLFAFLVLGIFALGFQAEAQPVTPAAATAPGPGAGRTVTETIPIWNDGTVTRYEGLHEGATTSGDRWVKSDGVWTKSGTWCMNGDDIDCKDSSGKVFQTNDGMANASNKGGEITGDGYGGAVGNWAD